MKNKIIPILSIFIILTFMITSNVFAFNTEPITTSDGSITYVMYLPDHVYNFLINANEYNSGDYNYFVGVENQQCHVYFIPKTVEATIWLTSSLGACSMYNASFSSSNPNMIAYDLREHDTSYVSSAYSPSNITKACGFYTGREITNNTCWMYTNISVYKDSSLTDFFFKAPVVEIPTETPVEIPEETPVATIPALETVEQIPEAMTTTLQVVIPVGLAILGIGLLIYLIKRVIYSHL